MLTSVQAEQINNCRACSVAKFDTFYCHYSVPAFPQRDRLVVKVMLGQKVV